jgi:3-hydroxyacyl-[acyl-carrier-protein] dehydratase
MWHSLNNLKKSSSGEVSAGIAMTADSQWFSGHFPGEPVLPGIAQLGIVVDALTQTSHEKPRIAGFSRVRFKQLVRPDDPLEVVISPVEAETGVYSFRLTTGSHLACSGIVKVRQTE